MALESDGKSCSAKILLVDDISMFLEIQKNILQALPVQIATARDGHEALRLVEQFGPDLVVMDANMPGMDGIACCSALKQHREHRRIPVIMTIPNCADNAELCRAAGCDALLQKPLETGLFLDAVTSFIPDIERRNRRVSLLAPVLITIGGRRVNGAIVNISRAGAFVEPDESLDIGAAVELTFTLPAPGHPTLHLPGRVTRLCSADAKGMNGGVGVAFTSDQGSYHPVPQNSDLARYLRRAKIHS